MVGDGMMVSLGGMGLGSLGRFGRMVLMRMCVPVVVGMVGVPLRLGRMMVGCLRSFLVMVVGNKVMA